MTDYTRLQSAALPLEIVEEDNKEELSRDTTFSQAEAASRSEINSRKKRVLLDCETQCLRA